MSGKMLAWKETRVGVFGVGMVGRAIVRGLTEWAKEIKCYDPTPERCTHTFEQTADCDLLFVAVPTPAREPTYECDLSILEELFERLIRSYQFCEATHTPSRPVICIKSTVPPGTTQRLAKRMQRNLDDDAPLVIHWPEFLTARCAAIDFQTPARNILGIPERTGNESKARVSYLNTCEQWLGYLCSERWPGVPVICGTSNESELAKLGVNGFFAIKVAYFNLLAELAWRTDSVDWELVRQMVLSDGRIAHSHTSVPGPDGMTGFGGACLPKDLLSLTAHARELGEAAELLNAAWEQNKRDRAESDPAKM